MQSGETLELDLDSPRSLLSVTELNRQARALIEGGFGMVWVEGEISNLSRPASGHVYFTLKDARAQVRCALFRTANRRLRFDPQDGDRIVAYGRVSLYEARGDFQLIAEQIEAAGEGLLRRRFEELKRRLAAEGLFDAARKRPLPRVPSRIGVITSATGAAIRDVLIALRRRFPTVNVLIYPTSVQGSGAAEEICVTLALANQRRDCDLLILTRGGGSLEDLWAFNEEIVARAVRASSLPIVVGVGHESDFTIAELAADLRAPTPSQAAELAVPDRNEWRLHVERCTSQLLRAVRRCTGTSQERLNAIGHRLERCNPRLSLRLHHQRLDDLDAALARCLSATVERRRTQLDRLSAAINAANPKLELSALRERCRFMQQRLQRAIAGRHERASHRLTLAERSLRSLSPLATLERGYAIVARRDNQHLVTDSTGIAAGTALDIRLARGRLGAIVDRSEPEPS